MHRSTFLRQRRQPLSNRGIRRIVVADEISRIHARSRGSYGKRRIKAALLAECEMIVNHKLVASIMSELGLHGMPRTQTPWSPTAGSTHARGPGEPRVHRHPPQRVVVYRYHRTFRQGRESLLLRCAGLFQ